MRTDKQNVASEDDILESTPVSCFVIGPIGDRDASVGSSERQAYEEAIQVWEDVILPACEGFGILPVRADQIPTTGEIPEQVFRRLRDSQLVIADLTGANPNVMYELGLRHTTGKLTIQIGERSRLPFDISAIRTIIFRRTEAGLIDARKRLAQAIGEGLHRGGDPVTATRVWFEHSLFSVSVEKASNSHLEDDEEEPGILEKLTDMLEGMASSTRVAESVASVTEEIGVLAREAASRTERINTSGGAPGAKLEIANSLAKKLEDPAARLEVLVGEYSQSAERIHPGVLHVLKQVRDSPEVREEASGFLHQIKGIISAVDQTSVQMQGFRNSLLESGEATRELRRVNRRIAGSVQQMLDTNARMREWADLIDEDGLSGVTAN